MENEAQMGESSYSLINFIQIIEDRGVKKTEVVIERSMKVPLLFSMLGKVHTILANSKKSEKYH